MKNDWNNIEANNYIRKYKQKNISKDLALRIYTTQLLGKNNKLVLHGGGNTSLNNELSEDDLYALELEAFMNLIQMPKTQERIKYTLETGKPLAN